MKKLISLLLAAVMLLSMTACGEDALESYTNSILGGNKAQTEQGGQESGAGNETPSEEKRVAVRNHNKTMVSGNEASYFVKSDGTLWGLGNIIDFHTKEEWDVYNAAKANGEKIENFAGTAKEPRYIMDGVKAIDMNSRLLYVLKEDNSLWCLGYTSLYDALETDTKYADFIKIMEDVMTFSVDDDVYLAVKSDGSVWGAGDNYFGILRWDSEENDDFKSPVCVMESDAVAVSVGKYAGYVVKRDGTVWGWGTDHRHSITENGDQYRYQRIEPTQIMDNTVFIEATERGGCFAIKEDNTLWVWGDQWNQIYEPTELMNDVAYLASDYWWDFAVKADGSVYGWGSKQGGGMLEDNPYGITDNAVMNQYDNGYRIHESNPVPLAVKDVVAAAVGADNAVFLLSDGTVYGSGNDAFLFDGWDKHSPVTQLSEDARFFGPLIDDVKIE